MLRSARTRYTRQQMQQLCETLLFLQESGMGTFAPPLGRNVRKGLRRLHNSLQVETLRQAGALKL